MEYNPILEEMSSARPASAAHSCARSRRRGADGATFAHQGAQARPAVISVLERIEQRIENMSTMLTRFGIDTAVFSEIGDGRVFTTSMRACQACANGTLCTAWLSHTSGGIDHVPEFCPNAERFAQTKTLLGIQGRPH